jgi:nicotinamide-nucleotide amidase
MIFNGESEVLNLAEALRSRKLTVGFGESCTGGLLSARMAALAGVSDIYMGSLVTYSYDAKVDLLGVQWATLNESGAVSEPVALEMVRGVCLKLKCTCSIGITGIAGPAGGTAEKPVGTVWIAVKGPTFEVAEKFLFKGDRLEIQRQSTVAAIALLRQQLR